MYKDRAQFEPGINQYVPAMQYSSAMVNHQPTLLSLGSPAAADDDLIAAAVDGDAVATTLESYDVTLDARYGRTLQVKVSGDPGAASSVIEVLGWDYLGQPMVERFTTANGATAIQWGKKAFKRIKGTRIVTAATNAITLKVGTGTRIGLPYKGDITFAKENGVLVPVANRSQSFSVVRSAALATAGGSVVVRPGFAGYVESLFGIPNGGGSTNDPVITVEIANVAITGLTVTIDTSDTSQTIVTDTPTTPGYNANNRFTANQAIEIVGAAAASAGGDVVGVVLASTQFTIPDLTDPATYVTGDPRGVYDPITPPNGTEIIVGMIGDPAVNTSNHGGLHGIQHYAA